jgi:hypothetical protein
MKGLLELMLNYDYSGGSMGNYFIKEEDGKEIVYERDWFGDTRIGELHENRYGEKKTITSFPWEQSIRVEPSDRFGERVAEIDGVKGVVRQDWIDDHPTFKPHGSDSASFGSSDSDRGRSHSSESRGYGYSGGSGGGSISGGASGDLKVALGALGIIGLSIFAIVMSIPELFPPTSKQVTYRQDRTPIVRKYEAKKPSVREYKAKWPSYTDKITMQPTIKHADEMQTQPVIVEPEVKVTKKPPEINDYSCDASGNCNTTTVRNFIYSWNTSALIKHADWACVANQYAWECEQLAGALSGSTVASPPPPKQPENNKITDNGDWLDSVENNATTPPKQPKNNTDLYNSILPSSDFARSTPPGYAPVVVEITDAEGNVLSRSVERYSKKQMESEVVDYDIPILYPKSRRTYIIERSKYPEFYKVSDLNRDGKITLYELGQTQFIFHEITGKYPEGDVDSIVKEFVRVMKKR